MAAKLELEIVSTDGVLLHEKNLDKVVVRQAEPEEEVGSLLGIFPGHAEMLVELQPGPLIYSRDGQTNRLEIGRAFLEVSKNRLRVVTAPEELPD